MFEAALQALSTLLTLNNIGMMLLGVCIGTLVGVLPGLGGTVGMSLVLPFIFGMEPSPALALLIGMAAVIHTADTFPSVLLGVPGSSGSQATIMDGYPLARKGEASRALSAAFFSSLFGGVVGALILFLILPIARPIVLAFASPELFMLTVLGLSMVGVLSGNDPIKGILAAALGLLIGTIGAAPFGAAAYRYTFGSLYLWDGIPLAVMALGLFALPELLDLLAEKGSIAKTAKLGKGRLAGLKDVIKHRWLVLRSSALGAAVGFIPGLGGSVVDWISYGVAAQTSKNSENFGNGDIRGVIAPESSNNAKEGGALIPTLLFGIPGSGTTAVLLGGFILLGINTGPRMIQNDLDIILLIIWTLAIANIFGALVCIGLAGVVARISTIPASRLVPFLLIIMMVGAYQSTRSWGDLLAFLIIGLLGWAMKHTGWPLPPVLIGFVLAEGAERYFFLSTARYQWTWLQRPGVLAIAAVTVALVMAGIWLKSQSRKQAIQVVDTSNTDGSS